MTEINPTLLLVLVEALALLAVIQVVLLVLGLLRRSRERKAVNTLIAAVTGDAEARAKRNGEAIGAALGVDGEPLQAHVKAAERAEKIVLQRFVIGWLRRDATAVATLPEALEGLVATWRGLLSGRSGEPAQDAGADPAELESLRAQLASTEEARDAIAVELKITQETMQRMLEEYAAMYQRGDRQDDSTARRILSGEQATTALAAAGAGDHDFDMEDDLGDEPAPTAATGTGDDAALDAEPEDEPSAGPGAPQAQGTPGGTALLDLDDDADPAGLPGDGQAGRVSGAGTPLDDDDGLDLAGDADSSADDDLDLAGGTGSSADDDALDLAADVATPLDDEAPDLAAEARSPAAVVGSDDDLAAALSASEMPDDDDGLDDLFSSDGAVDDALLDGLDLDDDVFDGLDDAPAEVPPAKRAAKAETA